MPCRGPYSDAEIDARIREELDTTTRVACELARTIEYVETHVLPTLTELDLSQEARDWIREHKILDQENELDDLGENLFRLEREREIASQMLEVEDIGEELKHSLENYLSVSGRKVTYLEGRKDELERIIERKRK